ncbi:MAG: MBL fold metallo-hydrolase [Chloroflexaceae bacterium]|nr:MBL fold metallo-hydrolase [Chloroflexaceae bacterium]
MSLRVTSFASGSSGNALLVQAGGMALLVDCGISLRAIEKYLRCMNIAPEQLGAVLLTHEHGDHTLSAAALARRYHIPVVCNGPTRAALGPVLEEIAVEVLPVGERASLGPFDVSSFLISHDAAAPVGYCISAGGLTLGLAVDLGCWDETIARALRCADLLVIEANHDREMLLSAPYPFPIRQRIFSPQGHLDNVQAGELLSHIGSDGRKRDVWLAHLSEQANSPRKAVEGVQRVLTLDGVKNLHVAALPRKSQAAPGTIPTWSGDNLLVQRSLFDG